MSNRLQYETSPYLLQHKDNPVDWYPWGSEAFEKAKAEDKPIFLSIGYSSCHWCHVIAHESFEDVGIAELLNRYFVCIKVDREERPDIDNVYMRVCQAFTGGGGWPTTIFMTAEQKPFFAGTYFPKSSRGGMIGFTELITSIKDLWKNDRKSLLRQADSIFEQLKKRESVYAADDSEPTHRAVEHYERMYDSTNGGFGRAPKFPAPHNLLFLLSYYERYKKDSCLKMAEHTLLQMYRGGMFDHIGGGFCRYSTDKKFLVPHFEKMLYDNALLILAYCKAYAVTGSALYLKIAEKTAAYILREMTSPEGGFYCAQDADSEGVEGKYYLFTPDEITDVLGKSDADAFNRHYNITESGNFEGKSIPNLLCSDPKDSSLEHLLPKLSDYRRRRFSLHLDDKILTSQSSLMIAAMCELYIVSKNELYLSAARKADDFIRDRLCEGETLYVSFRDGRRGVAGFLDDYAAYIFASLALHRATLDGAYLKRAIRFCERVEDEFGDNTGGFYQSGDKNEELILRTKEIYDGAIPSGNSLMAYNLVGAWLLTSDEKLKFKAEEQLDFLASSAEYPTNNAMFLTALLELTEPPTTVTVVPCKDIDCACLPLSFPYGTIIRILPNATEEYPLINKKTTYYACKGHSCLPPTNSLSEINIK